MRVVHMVLGLGLPIVIIGAIAATVVNVKSAAAEEAGAKPVSQSVFNGFSVGLGFGARGVGYKVTPPGLSGDVKANKTDFVGRMFVGYDQVIGSDFVVGAELGGDFGTKALTLSGGGNHYTAKLGSSVDLSTRAGLLLNPFTLIYFRNGYEWAQVNRTASDSLGKALSVSDAKRAQGILLGFGLDYAAARHLVLRSEFTVAGLGQKLANAQLLLGLSYRF